MINDDKEILLNDPEVLEQLYEFISDDEVETLGIQIEEEKFKITNEASANFFLRQLTNVRTEMDKINNNCNNEIEAFTNRVNAFRQKELHSLEGVERRFVTLLEEYARIQLADSKKKTYKTPFGSMSFRTSPDKYEYNEESLMEYIKNNDLTQFIKVKEELNKKEFKASLKIIDGKAYRDNVLIEGVTITPGEEKFSIK